MEVQTGKLFSYLTCMRLKGKSLLCRLALVKLAHYGRVAADLSGVTLRGRLTQLAFVSISKLMKLF